MPVPDNSLRDVFRVISDVLAPAGIDCLLIGGFAVNLHGYSRSTIDVIYQLVAEKARGLQA